MGAYWLVKPVAEIALPTTIQAVLAARVDRLEERQKQVLRTAAVIGRQFTEPMLRRVVELPEADLAQALDKLAAAEFIFEQALCGTLSEGRANRDAALEKRSADRSRLLPISAPSGNHAASLLSQFIRFRGLVACATNGPALALI